MTDTAHDRRERRTSGERPSATSVCRIGALCLGLALLVPAAAAAQDGGDGRASGTEDGTAQIDGLGAIHFPSSASGEAEGHFLRGVLLLHSFEYADAREAFQNARAADPDFALAYWGEALTHDHPLWRQQDTEAARDVLRDLAPTREERLDRASTERERAYLEAVETLYFGEGSPERRDTLYSRALERLVAEHPEDDEAKAFYALSLLGLNQGDRDVPTFMRAGAIALDLFERAPRHPGAVHYAIHSFDDPDHAPLGLEAARAYSEIAPEASHAQHMTSHIFLALGMWEDVVAANEAATRTTAREADHEYEHHPCGHNAEWLAYGYLQQGRGEAARGLITRCLELAGDDPGSRGSAARMRAHHLVDAGDGEGPVAGLDLEAEGMPARWALARDFGDALAATRRGELDAAREVLASLEGRAEGLREALAADARVMAGVLRAEIRSASGDTEGALEAARRAAEIAEDRPVPYGPPSTYRPPHELVGELLLESDRPGEARSAFARALRRTPRRPRALLGAARAAAAAGHTDEAAERYAELDGIWAGADEGWPGAREARRFLAEHGRPDGDAGPVALPR